MCVITANTSNSEENSLDMSDSSPSKAKILLQNLFLMMDEDRYGIMSSEKGNCRFWSIFFDVLLIKECSNLFTWKHRTYGSFRMDICFTESCLTSQCWQYSFWSEPNFSGLVKRSKHPIKVEILELSLDFIPLHGSMSSDRSTQGS